jgi:hypothetical protein
MNQVEQWFSILQRKRLRIADFADKAALAERLQAFITEWNQVAGPSQSEAEGIVYELDTLRHKAGCGIRQLSAVFSGSYAH